MRVISGKFKGKKLIEPRDKETRPLKDLTKESIFNIINHSNKFSIDLKKAPVLDLFSGVGSFGIECLSQGASHVTFIEKYEAVLPILKKNLDNLKSEINCDIIESDILNRLEFKSLKLTYDLIFLDPPYKEKALENILNKIISYLIVAIISFVALIIVLDTFKTPLNNIFPNLEQILFNLYETFEDIGLFFKDLIK